MHRKTLVLAALALLLPACTRTINQTPNPNEVATQVNQLLTTIPSTPQMPTALPTIPPVTATPLIGATATQSPTATASAVTPTATMGSVTPAATGTPVAGDPKTSLGAPTRAYNFDTADGWGVYANEHTRVEDKNGALVLTALNADGWTGWSLSFPILKDFYLEETLKPETCAGMDRFGVVFRAQQGTNAYLLGVNCDGQYSFYRFDGSTFTTIIDWKNSQAIHKGPNQTNRLGVMAKGDQFTFYANGVKLDEAKDTTYAEGSFGIFITSAVTPNFTVDADEADYWNLPEE